MSRVVRGFVIFSLALGVIGLVTSCNIIGGGSSGTGNLMMLMTDGPTDDWTEVTVHFLSASLHRQGADGWEPFWTATAGDPASGKVNLIDLSGISDILSAKPIPAGTYDRIKLVLNKSTLPDSMTLIPAESTTPIDPGNITVVDPSGTGEIKVDLEPKLVVEPDKNNIVSIDFDLSHPLSIVNIDGKVIISLKVRHHALPRNLSQIQFARTIGTITAATGNADGTATFKIKNLQGAEIPFGANGNTIYVDVSSGKAVAAKFDDFAKLVNTGSALVASNMNANGSLYARRVWFADTIDKLPQFTPEGLVRRVGDTWLSIQGKKTEDQPTGDHLHSCNWDAETIFVNDKTIWTFQGADMKAGGLVGLEGLQYVSRGFRVEVVSVDENVSPKIAQSINIQSAHFEGIVNEPTSDNFKLGWFWRNRTLVYSAVPGHEFGWWAYGAPATRSTDRQALIDMVAAARTSRLWVFAWAGLTWDIDHAGWAVEDLVLAPMKLHEMTKITEGYDAGTGSLVVSSFDCWDEATPVSLTVKLDTTGDLQTVVGSFIRNGQTNVVTFTLPVPPAQWAALLTPTIHRVKIWVHPVKEGDVFTWHAYTVIAYQYIQ